MEQILEFLKDNWEQVSVILAAIYYIVEKIIKESKSKNSDITIDVLIKPLFKRIGLFK